MLSTPVWNRLKGSEIAHEVEMLRQDSLRVILTISAAGYLVWNVAATVLWPPENELPYRSLFAVAVSGLALTYWLLRSEPRLAVGAFLATSILSITAAAWILEAPGAFVLYSVVALAAVVLLHPFAGVLTAVGSLGLLLFLYEAGPLGFVTAERLTEVAAALLLTVLMACALDRNLLIAVEWSLHSYEAAVRNAEEARNHRAQLAQSLKQLDTAYYRLERANAALEMAWKAAEAAERSKSEFVTNISHELRTPLNLIVGFAEMIMTSPESYGVPLPAPYRGDMNSIYRSAQHLLTLTDDVIDIARVGIGRMSLVREPVDLERIITDACDIVREYIAAKGLYLRIEVEPSLPALTVDHLRIRQVLVNLLTNASRFTERGGITVSARLQADRVLVSVADTGAGIAAEALPQVFREFYTTGGESHRRQGGFGGMGLGLPLSRRFVELHGGEMGVESALGSGTTMWFTLPVTVVEGSSQGDAWQPVRTPRVTTPIERVLVLVGADDQCARFLQRHLRGYRIHLADDIVAGVAAVVDHRAVALLADVRSVPEDQASQACPVPIFRLPLPHGDRMAEALGAVTYLTKPITRQRLSSTLEQLGRQVRTVLVIDDDPRFVRLITRMLHSIHREHKLAVVGVHTGQEALAQLKATRPDLILLDLVMPEVPGEDVLAAVAADSALAGVPIVVVSGQEQPEWQLPLDGSLSVSTPVGFHLEELLNAVEALLGVLEPPRGYLATVPGDLVELGG